MGTAGIDRCIKYAKNHACSAGYILAELELLFGGVGFCGEPGVLSILEQCRTETSS